ncbi:hypothetical protein EZ313_08125 [Ramlibacter henchirensis]|uniref:Transporter n=1 Tax=Ramlibacter henchirensis TaxID=204072 RepID=A0A4Z0C6I6_9BURK|nr:hypothetical protein [Ramlibacter henchirensis]TFZ06584.1 hypothetical protein EZ313_08125 [Ramlibacter henchirensis]
MNLDRGVGVEVTDAQSLKEGDKQFQFTTRFDRERGGDKQLLLEPEFQWGFAKDWQGSLSIQGLAGSADRTGSGDIRASLFRRFIEERGWLPALAGELQLDLPSGKDTRGVDPTLRLIGTKSLGEGGKQQFHLNLGWTRNNSPEPGERRERGQVIVGYSLQLGERSALVADVIREHQREVGQMATIAEVGYRRELSEQTTLGVGIGAGRGSDSAPRWRLTAAIERGF